MLYLGAKKSLLSSGKTLAAQIAALFAQGEQGAWYEPSLTNGTLFQDSAGTTPVTAVGQPVGLMLDKSGRGNHCSQPTAINRPVLSALVNLATVSASATLLSGVRAPYVSDGTLTPSGTPFYKLREDTTAASSHFGTPALTALSANTTYRATYLVAAAGRTKFTLNATSVATWAPASPAVTVDLVAKTAVGANGATGTITEVAPGVFRVGMTATYGATANNSSIYPILLDAAGSTSYTGDGASGICITEYDIRPVSQINLPPYQRVNTATDYDAEGFPKYLAFNGTNSWMFTAAIDFTATDKMTVVAGVRKLSDAAIGVVMELSANKNANNGAWAVIAPATNTTPTVGWYSKGTLEREALASALTSPVSVSVTGIGDISGDNSTIRVNGVQVAKTSGDQGAGNFGNYPLYIGARAGPSLYFNGNIYGLIIRGTQSSDSQIASAERFMNAKTGAY